MNQQDLPISQRVPLNDLSRGIVRDRALLEDAARKVFDSGYVVMGSQHDAFQAALAQYFGVSSAVCVASGTDALELAIKTAMPEGKHTVLTAANAGGYTTTAARRAGYRIRYADVDAETFCLSLATVADALSADVGVVVITHLYGNVTDIITIVELCHDRGIRVVEDCAQSIGGKRAEGMGGSFGDIAATSFYPTKNLGALGDGGAVLTNSEEFAQKVIQLRQYGWSSKYCVSVSGGVNSRLDEIQAAFLLARLPIIDVLNERRRTIISAYAAAAQGRPLRVLPADGPHHVGHLAVAVTRDREAAIEHFSRHGVSTDVHFPVPDHVQPGFKALPQSLPVTERAAGQVISLPCFPELTDQEIEIVCGAIVSLGCEAS